MNEDRSLTSTTNASDTGTPFGDPEANAPVRNTTQNLTIEEILTSARLVEKVARICLRADLQAEHDELLHDLAQMVDAQGRLIEDPEASLGGDSTAAAAQAKNDRLREVQRLMRESTWFVRFRGMPDEEFKVFHKAHYPKGEQPDLRVFNNKLIAATAIEPEISEEQVQQLRSKFTRRQMLTLENKAYEACTEGGVDVPKSPLSLQNLTQR